MNFVDFFINHKKKYPQIKLNIGV